MDRDWPTPVLGQHLRLSSTSFRQAFCSRSTSSRHRESWGLQNRRMCVGFMPILCHFISETLASLDFGIRGRESWNQFSLSPPRIPRATAHLHSQGQSYYSKKHNENKRIDPTQTLTNFKLLLNQLVKLL